MGDRRKQAQLCRTIAALLTELATSLEAEPAPPVSREPGRPRSKPSPKLVADVLRLRNENGRLGRRPIAEITGASEHMVRQILSDYALGENPHEVGENYSPSEADE